MPLKQIFKYTYPDNKEITIDDWIKTKTPEEQDSFYKSRENNYRIRQVAVDSGRMQLNKNDDGVFYVWANEDEFNKGKDHDPIFVEFFNRYLEETNVKFEVITVEV